jgi:predicted Zn-dependent protease
MMKIRVCQLIAVSLLFYGSVLCAAQSSQANQKLAEQAQREYVAGKFKDAERDFRELIKHEPANIFATMYLGHSLFRQEKYAEAVAPYEKARELERGGKKISEDEHHVLIDQLVMSYGISGQLKQAHALLDEAIQQDPEYPLNYYNLACTYAEEGNKSKMLENLSLAFQHKDHVLKGETMPDPRSDPSFQKYVSDSDFVSLMKMLGYQ